MLQNYPVWDDRPVRETPLKLWFGGTSAPEKQFRCKSGGKEGGGSRKECELVKSEGQPCESGSKELIS